MFGISGLLARFFYVAVAIVCLTFCVVVFVQYCFVVVWYDSFHVWLYRDDGLATCNKTARETENIKKEICKIFEENKLNITIEANKKIIDFLDITMALRTGVHKPFMKPNNTPLYVHNKSNHPPNIIKNIPESINRRLSNISSNEKIFKKAIPPYQDALKKSGYNYKLEYKPTPTDNNNQNNKQKNKRKRNITWFNPPYSNTQHQTLVNNSSTC